MSKFLLFVYRCNIGVLALGLMLYYDELKLKDELKQNYETIKKYTINLIATALLIVNLIMVFHPKTISVGKMTGIFFIIGFLCYIVYGIKNIQQIKIIGYLFIGVWMLSIIISSHGAYDGVPYNDSYELVGRYYITEVQEVPEVYVSGTRTEVKSTSGITYYITYKTEYGVTDTIAINRSKNPVTIIKNNKTTYSPSSYFEEYEVTRKYESFVPLIHHLQKFKVSNRYIIYY